MLKDINARAQNPKSNDLKVSAKGSVLALSLILLLLIIQPIDVAHAVLALKVLGRNPVGSDLITRPTTLSTLISAAEAFKDTPNATSEVLRCVANGLLLISDSRSTFVSKEVGGGPAVLGILEVRTHYPHIIRALLSPAPEGDFARPHIRDFEVAIPLDSFLRYRR